MSFVCRLLEVQVGGHTDKVLLISVLVEVEAVPF